MIFIFAIQCILLVICSPSETYGQTNTYEYMYACGGSESNITCTENERIHIVNAVYGRFPVNCNESNQTQADRCLWSNYEPNVRRLCSGKSACTVSASINVSGDPCNGTSKDLFVAYQCYSDAEVNRSLITYAYEGRELSISCKENERIHIEYASYRNVKQSIYSSNYSMPIVRRLCSEKSTCTIHANYNVFGFLRNDPLNSLYVIYWCYSDPQLRRFTTEGTDDHESLRRTERRTANIEPTTSDTEVNRSLTACACEGSELTISCKANENLHIEYANFGHLASEICTNTYCWRTDDHSNTKCFSINSLSIVRSLCSGVSNCTVSVSSSVFGNPCEGTPKYLEVIHRCYSDSEVDNSLTSYACEDRELTLSCKAGEILHIEYANFGRHTSDICNDGGQIRSNWNLNCYSSNSLSTVRRQCSGQSNCTVRADNTVFDDPCAYTLKYLKVIHHCYSAKYCDMELDEKHSIRWDRTLAGEEIYLPCPGNTTYGLCSRKCFQNRPANPVWSKTNCNGCFDKEFGDLLTRVNELNETALTNQTVVAAIVSQLSVLTNKSEGLSSGNLNASVMMINRLAVLRNNSTNYPSEREIESFVQTTSNVLQPKNSEEWKELEAINRSVATRILFSVEVYGRSLSTLNRANYSYEDADNLILDAWSLDEPYLPLQLEFPSRSVWGETRGDKISISLTAAALDSSISSEIPPTLHMWGSYYRTVNEFLPENKNIDVVKSRVLSFTIGGLKSEEKLDRPVIITLQHNQAERMCFQRTCAYWNFQRDEWDSTGCLVTSTNLTHTICSCDHLTNFAILMSSVPSYDRALSLISVIGCSISVVALILTIIVYALTWKESKSAHATVLLNLCVALVIAYIIFMAGADKVDSEDGCKAVAVLLHYFFLVVFFIMLAEGVELLIYVIFVFHVRRTRETILLVASAWVLPLIIVAVSLGSTKVKGYGNGFACWLSVDSGLIWAFVGPVLCIITANFVILTIVLVWMSRKRTLLSSNAKKRDEIRATIWNLSVTCPVLGLGWLFGVLSIVLSSVVFQYLFVIANSLQGLFIFIFHALFHNKKMKEKLFYVYSNYICRCRKTDHSVSSEMTSTQEPTEKTRDVKSNKRIEKQKNLPSTGTQLTSIKDSEKL